MIRIIIWCANKTIKNKYYFKIIQFPNHKLLGINLNNVLKLSHLFEMVETSLKYFLPLHQEIDLLISNEQLSLFQSNYLAAIKYNQLDNVMTNNVKIKILCSLHNYANKLYSYTAKKLCLAPKIYLSKVQSPPVIFPLLLVNSKICIIVSGGLLSYGSIHVFLLIKLCGRLFPLVVNFLLNQFVQRVKILTTSTRF